MFVLSSLPPLRLAYCALYAPSAIPPCAFPHFPASWDTTHKTRDIRGPVLLLVRAPHYGQQLILSSSRLQLPVVSEAAGAGHTYCLHRDQHLVVIANNCRLPLHSDRTSAAACPPTAHLITPSPPRLLQTVLPVLCNHLPRIPGSGDMQPPSSHSLSRLGQCAICPHRNGLTGTIVTDPSPTDNSTPFSHCLTSTRVPSPGGNRP